MKQLMVLSAFVLSTVAYGNSKVVETPAQTSAQKKVAVAQPAQEVSEEEVADLIVMDEEEAALEAPAQQ